MKGEGLTFDDLRDAAVKLSGIRVHVVGDTIVDSYTQCSMIGGVAKTPTMSVRFESKQDFTGGAAVVAKHLRAAGGDVVFSTVLGDDALKDQVLEDLAAHGIRCLPIVDPTRPSYATRRACSRGPQPSPWQFSPSRSPLRRLRRGRSRSTAG